jgi:hypothetical protein
MRWTEADLMVYQGRQGTQSGNTLIAHEADTKQQDAMPEDVLLQHIRATARRLGFVSYHTRNSRKSDPGFPDLLCCNGTRILAIETKSATGKVTSEQALWLSMLQQTGKVETYVLRPADLPQIETILRGTP